MLAEDHDQALMWLADEATILSSRGLRKVLEVEAESTEGQAAVRQLSLLGDA